MNGKKDCILIGNPNRTRHLKIITWRWWDKRSRKSLPWYRSNMYLHVTYNASLDTDIKILAPISSVIWSNFRHRRDRISGRGFLGLPQNGVSCSLWYRSPVPFHHLTSEWPRKLWRLRWHTLSSETIHSGQLNAIQLQFNKQQKKRDWETKSVIA